MNFFKKHKIDEIECKLTRDELLRRSRILIIDDDKPDLINDLKQAGFAVDYESDITVNNISVVERQNYDLIILDFGSVGSAFGSDEGLSLLRHIKRVYPSVVVFAYTSKALGTKHADFFRLADAVLRKDAGIAESMEKIEDGLRRARSINNLWSSMLHTTNITPGSKEDFELQDLYVRGLSKPQKMNALTERVIKAVGGEEGKKVGLLILGKLAEAGAKHLLGV